MRSASSGVRRAEPDAGRHRYRPAWLRRRLRLNPIAAGRLGATVVIWIVFGGAERLPALFERPSCWLAPLSRSVPPRGLLLALIVAVFLSGLRYRVIRGRLAVLVSAATLALIAGVGNAVLSESGARILSESGETGSTARSALWATAVNAMKVWPEGIGFGQFAETGRIGSLADYPHNLILEISLEAGVFAGFMFVVGIMYVGRQVWASTESCGLRHFALLVFWTFTSMFSSDINGNRVVIIAMFGLIAAYRRVDADEETDGQTLDNQPAGGRHVAESREVRVNHG
ncbi:MAG: O-antigen ligase family protein [Acidimicrobiales bacterium]